MTRDSLVSFLTARADAWARDCASIVEQMDSGGTTESAALAQDPPPATAPSTAPSAAASASSLGREMRTSGDASLGRLREEMASIVMQATRSKQTLQAGLGEAQALRATLTMELQAARTARAEAADREQDDRESHAARMRSAHEARQKAELERTAAETALEEQLAACEKAEAALSAWMDAHGSPPVDATHRNGGGAHGTAGLGPPVGGASAAKGTTGDTGDKDGMGAKAGTACSTGEDAGEPSEGVEKARVELRRASISARRLSLAAKARRDAPEPERRQRLSQTTARGEASLNSTNSTNPADGRRANADDEAGRARAPRPTLHAAARAAWRGAVQLAIERSRQQRAHVHGAFAAGMARLRKEAEAQSTEAQLERADKAVVAKLAEARAELRRVEAARRRGEARLAHEMAFRERLHSNVTKARRDAAATNHEMAPREWAEIMDVLRAKAEAEAASFKLELHQALSAADDDRAGRSAALRSNLVAPYGLTSWALDRPHEPTPASARVSSMLPPMCVCSYRLDDPPLPALAIPAWQAQGLGGARAHPSDHGALCGQRAQPAPQGHRLPSRSRRHRRRAAVGRPHPRAAARRRGEAAMFRRGRDGAGHGPRTAQRPGLRPERYTSLRDVGGGSATAWTLHPLGERCTVNIDDQPDQRTSQCVGRRVCASRVASDAPLTRDLRGSGSRGANSSP